MATTACIIWSVLHPALHPRSSSKEIETEQQLEAARSTGATHVQGFLLSKPVVLPQFPQKKGKFGLREVG